MGLLASVVAYLSVVGAIVVGFLMSADALLQHSHQRATNPRPEITTAAKLGSSTMKKAAKPLRNAAEQQAIPQRSMAMAYRRKMELPNPRIREPHKRPMHEARRRSWPLQRQHAAAPRALGYAEAPRFSGDTFSGDGFSGDPWR
jgi:hypothetical protein